MGVRFRILVPPSAEAPECFPLEGNHVVKEACLDARNEDLYSPRGRG